MRAPSIGAAIIVVEIAVIICKAVLDAGKVEAIGRSGLSTCRKGRCRLDALIFRAGGETSASEEVSTYPEMFAK